MLARSSKNLEELLTYTERRKAWYSDATLYAQERLGFNPTWQQGDILDAISEPGAKVSVRSGHGVGKSGAIAASVLWFLETREYPKIPCTAPTSAQLRDILWAEIAKWVRNSDKLNMAYHVSPELWLSNMFTVTRDRVYDPSAKGEWYAVARTSGRDNPDALQGFHASNVIVDPSGKGLVKSKDNKEGHILFVIDEASGVFEGVFEVAEGALSSHGARSLMAGNPTRNTGSFANSHKKDRSQYKIFHFRSEDSPLVDPEYKNRLIRKYGKGSNIVRVRADGEFPKQEDDVLISLEDAEAALPREIDERQKTQEIRMGVDVARFGDDRTTFVIRQGNIILYAEIASKKSTMWTVGRAISLRKKFKVNKIFVDVIGVGAGVCDRLREQKENVIDVNVANSSPPREGEQGRLLRDYLWLEMANWLKSDEPSFVLIDKEIAEDLAGELASTKYGFDSSGRIIIESKDGQKKRLGHSPDIADGLGVTFANDSLEIYIG